MLHMFIVHPLSWVFGMVTVLQSFWKSHQLYRCFYSTGKLESLCFSLDQRFCTPTTGSHTTSACCILNKTDIELTPISTLLKIQQQCFCGDFRMSLPPCDVEVPFIVNVCGLTLCFDWTAMYKFDSTVSELREIVKRGR
jgi:hypothetical protein